MFDGGIRRECRSSNNVQVTLPDSLNRLPAEMRSAPISAFEAVIALTRSCDSTVLERLTRDSAFAHALLAETAALFFSGDAETARLSLRNLVISVLGFEELADVTGKPSKSLRRMLSRQGNPNMDTLGVIFGALQQKLGIGLKVEAVVSSA